MKKAIFLIGSACWFLFSIGFGVILVRYMAQGAGLQFSAWIFSSWSVVVGMVHIIGLAVASLVCLAVSAGLWARSFRPDGGNNQLKI